MSDDPTPDWFLRDPVVEALREAEALRNAGRLN